MRGVRFCVLNLSLKKIGTDLNVGKVFEAYQSVLYHVQSYFVIFKTLFLILLLVFLKTI